MDCLRFAVLVTALSAAACGPGSPGRPSGSLNHAEFMTVMQELQLAPAAERPAILEKHGTSDAEIRAYMERLSQDPMAMASVMDTLAVRIDRARFKAVQEPLPGAPK